jgi:hypothetical protein
MFSDNPFLGVFLAGLATQAPQMLVCVAALLIVPEKLRRAASARTWALWGFGLALLLGLLLPVAQAALQARLMGGALPPTQVALVFAGFGMFASLLHAIVLALLLAAVLSSRSAPAKNT